MNLIGPAKKNSSLTWAESQHPTHLEYRETIQKANWCLSELFSTCRGHQKARLARLQTVLHRQVSGFPHSSSCFLCMNFMWVTHNCYF